MSTGWIEQTVDRRKLTRSPLVNAIWQLRFTSDVRLSDGRAAKYFQNALDHQTTLTPVEGVPGAPFVAPALPQMQQPASTPGPAWKLSSPDAKTTVTLAEDVVTLESTRYQSWEQHFQPWISDITAALQAAFAPGLTTRLGIRYVNVIFGQVLAKPPLNSISDFRPYLHPALLGFAEQIPGAAVGMLQGRQILDFGAAQANVNHTRVDTDHGEAGMLLDIDTYLQATEEFDAEAVHRSSERLHDLGLALFQTCLTAEAWSAMEPVPVDLSANT